MSSTTAVAWPSGLAPPPLGNRVSIMSLSLDVIAADLSALRPGIKHEITDIDESCKGGCFNLHFPIVFEDGVKWILRVRRFRPHDTVSPDDYWFGVEREVTTLQTMFESGMRTVSNAYLPPTRTSVTPGYDTAHFYCDFMPGEEMVLEGAPKPEAWVKGVMRSQPPHPIFGYDPHLGVPSDLSEARKFMASFADHMIGISNLSFRGIGQLVRNQSGQVEVGPMTQQAGSPGPWRMGPCESLQEALFGYWDEQFAASNVSGRGRLRSYLSLLDKKRLIRSFGPLAKDPKTTYIKHPDEAIMQYFADKGLLSAVLDWEWAYTTVKEQAFMAPKAFMLEMGRDLQDSEELDPLTREEELLIEAYEAKDRPDLADCVRSGPMYRLIDIDHQYPFRTIQAVTRFRRTFGRGIKDLTFPKTIDDWREECLELFHDDPGLAMFSAEDHTPFPEGPPAPLKSAAEMQAHWTEITARFAAENGVKIPLE